MPFGKPRTFDKKFKFVVEIDGVGWAGFQKASELSAEVAEIVYHEGGSLLAHKDPGRVTISDVTLMRGATRDEDLWNWFKQVVDQTASGGGGAGGEGAGVVDPDFRRNAEIVQLNRDGTELRRWPLEGCWPKKFVAGDWDNEADENVIEQVTLSVHKFDKSGK
jgi:phage tail-like protein